MAIRVDEIMNPEVFAVRPDETVDTVRRELVRLGISGAPVVDADYRVVGVVSLKDLVTAHADGAVKTVMSSPALMVARELPIALAARLMTEASCHRLIIVDDERAVGVVGTLDIMRAQLGLPTRHPATFPHYDAKTGVVWSDDSALEWGQVEAAPEHGGVVLVIRGGAHVPEMIVWGESTENLRATVSSYLDPPSGGGSFLGYWLRRGALRFRTATIESSDERMRVLAATCS